MKKLLLSILLLCAVQITRAQSVTNISFVIVPIGANTWAWNQVYLRDQIVNTNLVGLGLSNYIQLQFRQQITNVNRQEQLAARTFFSAFDSAPATNKVQIIQLLGGNTNSVAPADIQ